ncbi:beta-lactamase/transpeptidase-like protein [Hyaloscypha sp. PMI_1271]|nr:beta-lactamase/transpeptidase-like protein [Hyaloscypha sp. PMI_1271]
MIFEDGFFRDVLSGCIYACLHFFYFSWRHQLPLEGPIFQKPQNLSTSATIKAAIQDLTAVFVARDADNATGGYTNSLTKIFTVYTFLVEAGDIHFNSPITDYIPERAALVNNRSANVIKKVAWEDITIGDLASHMAGIAPDNSLVGELTQAIAPNVAVEIGFPPLAQTEVPTCEFFAGFSHLYRAFAPGETPAYSNVAFQILSYALETMTGRNYQTSFQDKLLKPLNLAPTFYTTPNESVGVIPENPSTDNLGAGMMYSTVANISSLGRSILRSSLLSPAQTRRWLKPTALTSDIRETVGYPWGIRRIIMDPDRPYELITAYNKAGSIGSYSSLLALLPEFGIGFSLLVAGDHALNNWVLADTLGSSILPAVQQAVRAEAQANYAGNHSNSELNSSVTFTTDASKPGLGITSWISNGTDMMAISNYLLTSSISAKFSARLYPTDLQVTAAGGSKQVVLKAIFEDLANQAKDSKFTAGCGTWIGPTAFVYGALALDEFIFTLDPSGNAVSVEVSALRLSMSRTST